MGLDITAYENSTFVSKGEYTDDGWVSDDGSTETDINWSDHHVVNFNYDCPGREEGLENEGLYTNGDDPYSFRAGSYSGYSWYRDQLAELAEYEPVYELPEFLKGSFRDDYLRNYIKEHPHYASASISQNGPFFEQINFSDCEGVLGTTVCQRLLMDYDKYAETVKKHENSHFIELYSSWHEAFRKAANNGHIDFH